LIALGSVVVLCLAVLLLDAPPFRRGIPSITGYGDNAVFNFPVRLELARQWREGRLPTWNPYKFAGFPLLGDITSAALYPGNLPFLLDASAERYVALDLVAALHFVLAALLMYLFARSLALGRAAAALSGLVYAGNGILLNFTIRWIQAQNAAVWLPLILAAVQRASTRGGFALWTAIGAAAVALQVLAGYPQFVFYTALVSGGFALALAIGRDGERWRPLAVLAAIYVLGAALAAVQLLPALDLVAMSRRAGAVSMREFLALASAPDVLPGLVIPRRIGSPAGFPSIGTTFVGTIAVVLAIEGARSRRHVPIFLVVTLILTILLALGPATPVGALAYFVPGLNAFRYPVKHLFEVSFCCAALAGIGAQSVLDGRRGARACVATAALAACVVLAAHLRGLLVWPWIVPTTLASTAAFALLVVAGRRRAAIAVALLATWLGFAGNRDAPFAFARRSMPPMSPVPELLAPRVTSALGPRYLAAVASLDAKASRFELLSLDLPVEFRIPAVNGTSPFLWRPLREALGMTEDGHTDRPRIVVRNDDQAVDVLGVRYVGSRRAPIGKPVLHESEGVTLTERPTGLPPLRFVDRVRCMDQASIGAELHRRTYDFAAVALLDCTEPPVPDSPARRRGRLTMVEASPGRIVVRARLQPGPSALLVVSQADMPGWRARVDGVRVPIHRAYGLVQGVVVPPGAHQVELEYVAPGLRTGALVSLLGLITTLVLLGLAWRHARLAGPTLKPTDSVW
jgi:hypothetical protein